MNKISKILMGLLGLAMVVTSCKSPMDENPVAQDPTTFVLNVPAMSKQFVDLASCGGVNLTCSQPDYGYSAVTTYEAQVSLDNENWSDFLDTKSTKANMALNAEEIAIALCALQGIENDEDFALIDGGKIRPVYFRLHASTRAEGSGIFSNSVCMEQVRNYCAVKQPGFIYLIGQPGGWTGPEAGNAEDLAKWRLFEDVNAIGSQIYKGTFEINAGEFQLRFYSALTGWDGGASIGAQVDDNPVQIELTDGAYAGDLVAPGKGSWEVPGWEGGTVTITVNLNNKKVSFSTAAATPTNELWLIGDCGGWVAPDAANADALEAWKLYEYNNNGIYVGTFDIPAGKFMFKFYTALTGWDGGAALGAQEADENFEIEFEDGVAMGPLVAGKGNYNDPTWAGGKCKISLDTNEGIATFEVVE